MQFDQIISAIKADPVPAAVAGGAYLIVGAFILWRICRSGDGDSSSATGLIRALLTGIFALPIWPIVWLVWILHFRKFAPDAIDLTRFRLPVVDLAQHRPDDLRFAPKKVVVDAEIVESPDPGSTPPKDFKPFASSPPPKGVRPKAKTKPVSAMADAKKKPSRDEETRTVDSPPPTRLPSDEQPQAPGSKKLGNPPPQSTVKPPPPGLKKTSPPPTEAQTATTPAPEAKPANAPPPPKIKRPSAASPPPKTAAKDSTAPQWQSVAVDPRKPEPPSAPPFVRKIERPASADGREKQPPAPFPSPSDTSSPEKADHPPLQSPLRPSVSEKPDVPEIPIS